MSGPGHNNPPPVEAFALHIEELFSLVSGSTASPVSTDEQEAALDALLDEVRQARKGVDAQRVAEKKPHDDAAKAVQAAWKPLLERCDKAAGAIKDVLTPYRSAKQRAKDQAARKAREEAEAKERAAQEALKSSEDLEAKFEAEEQLRQASKLKAQANRVDREATGLRTYKVVTVTDYRAALKWIMANRAEAITEFVEQYASKNAATWPMDGVTVTEEKRAA